MPLKHRDKTNIIDGKKKLLKVVRNQSWTLEIWRNLSVRLTTQHTLTVMRNN